MQQTTHIPLRCGAHRLETTGGALYQAVRFTILVGRAVQDDAASAVSRELVPGAPRSPARLFVLPCVRKAPTVCCADSVTAAALGRWLC